MIMEENNTKEINLLQLITLFFNWLKKVLTGLINAISYIIRLSYRNKITVIIVITISIIIGQYLARPSARTYNAEGMVMLYGTESQTVKEVCKQLENSLASNKQISLATKLSLPDSVAKNIVQVQSFYVIDYLKDKTPDKIDFDNNHSLTDTLNLRMKDRLYFRLKIRKISQMAKIENAIVNYLNNNLVLKTEFVNHKNEFVQQIKICDLELQRIDSLAKVSYFKNNNQQMSFENNKLIVGEQKKQLFYDDLLRLQSIKTYAQIKLSEFIHPVEIPSGFVINPTPLNGRVKYGVLSLFFGFVIGIVIAGLKENIKNINSYFKK